MVSLLKSLTPFCRLAFCLLASLALGAFADRAISAEFMFRATVAGRTLEGKPLAWTDTTMTLLGRDGHLHEFAPSQAKGGKKTSPRFEGYTTEEMRQRLYEEFGTRFEINSSAHYLVAHPRSQNSIWLNRFEELYRSFGAYFRVRGFRIDDPPYPLVAVVFGSRLEYDQYVRKNSPGAPSGALGHYEPRSNRVYLFDQSNDFSERWADTASTVIHEATHQTAYNVGLHTRFAPGPRWVSEGLATMFEARGVHSSRSQDRQTDRINYERLRDYRQTVEPNEPLGSLANYLSSDQSFQRVTIPAYAQAWALTFFLSETRPQEYADFLARLAARPNFEAYAASERVADFERSFGDLEPVERHFKRYLKELR